MYKCTSCQGTTYSHCAEVPFDAGTWCLELRLHTEPVRCESCNNVEGAISRLSLFLLVTSMAPVPWSWQPKKYMPLLTPDETPVPTPVGIKDSGTYVKGHKHNNTLVVLPPEHTGVSKRWTN